MAYKDIEKRKANQKKWRENNREYIRNYNQTKGKINQKKYYEKNKDEINRKTREYRKKTEVKERISENNKDYHKKNKDKINERKREYSKRPEIRKRKAEIRREYNKLPKIKEINKIRDKTKHNFPLANKKCKICKGTAKHHHHYTNPYKFDKFWYVCIKCHEEVHEYKREVISQ